jgi:hypothetical protein
MTDRQLPMMNEEWEAVSLADRNQGIQDQLSPTPSGQLLCLILQLKHA